VNTPARESRRRLRRIAAGSGLVALVALGAAAAVELHGSFLQSRYLSRMAGELHAAPLPGPSPSIAYPAHGGMDRRYGYTRLPEFIQQLSARGWTVEAQARQATPLAEFIAAGYHPPYPEKAQAGLRLLDCTGRAVQTVRHPKHAYDHFDAIPPVLGRTLLFIEDRELLAPETRTSNPAVEPVRLVRALLDEAVGSVDRHAPDGMRSTLAVRAERHRHGPEGRSVSIADRWRYMVSASVRAYRDGEDTVAARRRIVVDYLNSLPLGRLAGRGEVYGLGDGLAAWYGTDFTAVNAALRDPSAEPRALRERGRGFRQVLSLLIAQRQPAYYLGPGQGRLARLADRYLHLLAREGIIDEGLRDAALAAWMPVHEAHAPGHEPDASQAAAAGAPSRAALATLLGTQRLAEVEHLDLDAATTLDVDLQGAVTEALQRLRDPQAARAAGLAGEGLLERGDAQRMRYTFTLVERGPDGVDRVRVQADSAGSPTADGDVTSDQPPTQPAHADLMGVIVNEGWRIPPVLFDRLRFGAGTPYETTLKLDRRPAEQVMPPEDAAALARAMVAELGQGEGRRLRTVFDPLPAGGQATRDGPRSATFVFFIGERHHGNLTAHIAGGSGADDVRFGAELPAQVLHHLAPLLRPALMHGGSCPGAVREGPTPARGLRVDTRQRTRVSAARAPRPS
jgi:membrane peptidoglycan carboxypeptidase